MLFNLDFANNIISSCFFFFFLVIELYFLIPAVIAQIQLHNLKFLQEYQLKKQKQKWKHMQ